MPPSSFVLVDPRYDDNDNDESLDLISFDSAVIVSEDGVSMYDDGFG